MGYSNDISNCPDGRNVAITNVRGEVVGYHDKHDFDGI
jgi:hypothetical protein